MAPVHADTRVYYVFDYDWKGFDHEDGAIFVKKERKSEVSEW